jgi:cyclohexyl-isocyanide hydratase
MIKVGVLIFPQVEELDFVGPFEVLSYINKIQSNSTKLLLVAETTTVIPASNGMRVVPDITFADCPQLDILVVPGGKGRLQAMHNAEIKNFIVEQAKQAKYITSVCTGAFILAEASLLQGKQATTYHTAFSELATYPHLSVEKTKVVHDGNIITSGGVSSGIELGFYLLKILFGLELAQAVAAKIEYNIDINHIV